MRNRAVATLKNVARTGVRISPVAVLVSHIKGHSTPSSPKEESTWITDIPDTIIDSDGNTMIFVE